MPRITIDDLKPLESLTPQELDELYGAGRPSFRPGVESLEERKLMSVSPLKPTVPISTKSSPLLTPAVIRTLDQTTATFDTATGKLKIEGTNRADKISVTSRDDAISVSGLSIKVGKKTVTSIPKGSVTKIEVDAKDGNDSVDLSSVNIPAHIYGGRGNDTLRGTKEIDHIFGGDGDDTLSSGSIDSKFRDFFDGGSGKNTLAQADQDLLNERLSRMHEVEVQWYEALDGPLKGAFQPGDKGVTSGTKWKATGYRFSSTGDIIADIDITTRPTKDTPMGFQIKGTITFGRQTEATLPTFVGKMAFIDFIYGAGSTFNVRSNLTSR